MVEKQNAEKRDNIRDDYHSAGSQNPWNNWTRQLCQDICDLNEAILDVALLDDGDLVAIHSKSNVPASIVTGQKSFSSIFFQLSLIFDLYRSKEEIYGHLESFGAHFRNGDILCFSIDSKYFMGSDKSNNDRKRNHFVIAIWLRPHDCDDSVIISKVRGILQKRFLSIC
jgi:hypothetical protein